MIITESLSVLYIFIQHPKLELWIQYMLRDTKLGFLMSIHSWWYLRLVSSVLEVQEISEKTRNVW